LGKYFFDPLRRFFSKKVQCSGLDVHLSYRLQKEFLKLNDRIFLKSVESSQKKKDTKVQKFQKLIFESGVKIFCGQVIYQSIAPNEPDLVA